MFTLEYFPPADDLIERRTALSLQSNISDMAEYAEEWNKLAADFDAIGFAANAEMCRSNWMRYRQYDPVEVVRLVEGSFAEIIPVMSDRESDTTFLADREELLLPGHSFPDA
jgi:hypothetical protein